MIVVHMSSPRVLLAAALVLCAAACNNDSGFSSTQGPTVPSTVNTATTQLTVIDLVLGTGATANVGSRITVSYGAWLYDPAQPDRKGRQFDSSNAATFTVGARQVIPGEDQGVVGMRVGGQRRLIIPPEFAFGNAGSGNIVPPNSTVVYDIRLISVG
jgi:FKBP-type peptidyl-prolyl cis-trans isomerase FkpA